MTVTTNQPITVPPASSQRYTFEDGVFKINGAPPLTYPEIADTRMDAIEARIATLAARTTGVWNDVTLRQACSEQELVTPYDPTLVHKASLINPASIDLRLGEEYYRTHPFWSDYNLREPEKVEQVPLWGQAQRVALGESFWLMPHEFVLCHSLETVKIPRNACALLFSKSTTGRIGLEHLHAGFGDPVFNGQWTWELHNVSPKPIRMIVGKPYMQMVLFDMAAEPERTYAETGRYQHQTGATPARE